MKEKTKLWIGAVGWLLLLFTSVGIWGDSRHDPHAMLLSVFRILIVVPLATALSIGALLLFDRHTPGDWLAGVADDQYGNIGTKISTGLVVATSGCKTPKSTFSVS